MIYKIIAKCRGKEYRQLKMLPWVLSGKDERSVGVHFEELSAAFVETVQKRQTQHESVLDKYLTYSFL